MQDKIKKGDWVYEKSLSTKTEFKVYEFEGRLCFFRFRNVPIWLEKSQHSAVKIPYINELNSLLKDLFSEPWMDENDWDKFISEVFKGTKLNYKLLSDKVQEGIDVGFTLEEQIEIIKKAMLQHAGQTI